MSRPLGKRDEQGWRIPKAGTQSREIYDLMKKGYELKAISQKVIKPRNTLAVLMWKIRNPETANENSYKYSKFKKRD